MTGGLPAARDRTADPAFSGAGLKARLTEAVADRDAIAAERDAAVAEWDEAAAALAAAQGRVSQGLYPNN